MQVEGLSRDPYGGAAVSIGDALESLQCVLSVQGRLAPVLRSDVLCEDLERVHPSLYPSIPGSCFRTLEVYRRDACGV